MISVKETEGNSYSLTVIAKGRTYYVPNLGYDSARSVWKKVCVFPAKSIYTCDASYLRASHAFQLTVVHKFYATLELCELAKFGATCLPKGYAISESLTGFTLGHNGKAIIEKMDFSYMEMPIVITTEAIYFGTIGEIEIRAKNHKSSLPKYYLPLTKEDFEQDNQVSHEGYATMDNSFVMLRNCFVRHVSFPEERRDISIAISWLFYPKAYERAPYGEKFQVVDSLRRITSTMCYKRVLRMLEKHVAELWKRLYFFSEKYGHEDAIAIAMVKVLESI